MKRRKLCFQASNNRRKSFKMSLLNESVIICDTPKNNKPSQKIKKRSRKDLTSPPARQTRSRRKPLYPVQISPLSRRNMRSNKSPQPNKKKKRSHQSEILLPRKRQKTGINETIVISDDDDNDDNNSDDGDGDNNGKESGVSHGSQMSNKLNDTPEIIIIDNCTRNSNNKRLQSRDKNITNSERKRKKIIEDKIKDRKKSRKVQNMRRTRNRARQNTAKNPNKNDEDVAVVWSSAKDNNTENGKNEKTNSENNNKTEKLFFVDTNGDVSNLEKVVLLPPSEILYTTNTSTKFDVIPTTLTTTVKISEQVKSTDNTKTINNQSNETIPKLREIIVDGLNVAYGYSLGKRNFEKNGLQLVLDYFQDRGHSVKIFLPQIQRNRDRNFLEQWYRDGLVVFTPSRKLAGKKIVPYDDRFILEYATKCKGIVVSSDQYRDLWKEKPEWRETIEERLLAPTFAGEYVMFPEDPLGRGGPSLHEFLRH